MPAPSLWRPGPGRLARLLLGLCLFGAGEGLVTLSELGNSPWTVFAEGVSKQTPLSIGTATVATSFALLLIWIPLGVRPGLGTILNAIIVGVAIDVVLALLGKGSLPVRIGELLGGIGLVGLGSGFYLSAALGPGPRDGLMTGLHRRTGRPLALIRGLIEATAFLVGAILGGTFGVGTVTFALLVGPVVALALKVLDPAGAATRGREQAEPAAAATP